MEKRGLIGTGNSASGSSSNNGGNRRHLVLVVIFIFAIIYLTPFYEIIGIPNHFQILSFSKCTANFKECLWTEPPGSRKYLVYTNGCTIIEMDPFDSSVKPFLKKGHSKYCKEVFVSIKNQKLKIDVKSKKYKSLKTTCCYKDITRVTQNKINYTKDADWSITVSKTCKPIPSNGTGVFVKSEFLQIECKGMETDYLVNVLSPPDKSELTKKKATKWKKVKASQLPPSVLVIGIDSISRMHMHRQMPNTKSFLEQNDFIEMKGFTKVGENTNPNLMSSIAGMLPYQYPCWPKHSSKFDDCPFIWKNFSDQGYLTGLIEDSPGIAIFNYEKTGFVEQPVDYYLRPLLVASHLHHKYGKSSGEISCFGGMNPTEFLKQYIERILEVNVSKYPYFLLSWFTSIGHDDFNGLQTADNTFRNLLKTSMKGPDNTVILFISDHGYRFGKFRETFLGFYEESLPFFYIRIPKTIKSKFPSWYANLKENQDKLTTPLDLYRTFQDILQIETPPSPQTTNIPGTFSFFETIPGNRTCESAHIPGRYCMCGVVPELSQKSERTTTLSKYIVTQLNLKLESSNTTNQCHLLKFSSVLYGRQLVPGEIWNQFGRIVKYQDFLVAFKVNPGNGHFESKIRLWENGTLSSSPASRINSYKGQGDCMTDYELKGLCMCKRLVKA